MAPTRTKKRKSTESASSVEVQSFPAPPQMIPTKSQSPAKTPSNRSPIKKRKGITLGQKQALIDNLQQEITQRARKLRAQYGIQAQGLKTRIEIRVNRIPTALRKAKMGDLLMQYHEKSKATASGPAKKGMYNSPRKNLLQAEQSQSRASPSPQRAPKRMSDEIEIDKENEDVDNPKKRQKGAPNPPARTTSRAKLQPSQVLSPRSANSRTLPRSPIRPASPGKSMLARPISPLKPMAPVTAGGAAAVLHNMVDAGKGNASRPARKPLAEPSTGAGRGRRVAPPAAAPRIGRGRASNISESSDSSTSTTIVRKPLPIKKDVKSTAAAAKKGVMSTIKGMGSQKKMPAAAKTGVATSAGGRVLRKRN